MFECNGEVDKFAYDDCKIIKVNVSQNVMAFTVEALAVEPDNSQNNNFTKSYAGDTDIVFTDMQIVKAVKEGYRYYDADGNLALDASSSGRQMWVRATATTSCQPRDGSSAQWRCQC